MVSVYFNEQTMVYDVLLNGVLYAEAGTLALAATYAHEAHRVLRYGR